jgi:pteridine reductase
MPQAASDSPVVLVTGAARRVGAAIVRRLHRDGYDVAVHCRHSRDARDRLIGELEATRAGSTLALEADLADVASLPALVDRLLERFGRLDALVNNASAFHPTPIGSIEPAQWDELFAANARAPLFLSQAAAAALAARRGAIVNLTDIYAERPLANHVVYCMAKAALAAMTRALAVDLAPQVRVNAVAPGAVLWPESGKPDGERERLIAQTPLRRMGAPDDVAGAVLWLLRDAPFVTGETLRVDGGRALAM